MRNTYKRLRERQAYLTEITGMPLLVECNMANRYAVWTAEIMTREDGFQYSLPLRQLTREYLPVGAAMAWLEGAIKAVEELA